MRLLYRSSAATFVAALLVPGCSEPPASVTDSPIAAPAAPATTAEVTSIEAGAGGPKRAQAALDQRQAWRRD